MRKFLAGSILAVILSSYAFAASTYTSHYSLAKTADGSTTWGSELRDNFDLIDTQLYVASNGVTNHIQDTVGAHAATAISTTSGASTCLTSLTVQDYLDCLDGQFGTITGGTVVNVSGNQTITGLKTFTSLLTSSGGQLFTGGLTIGDLSTGVLHADSSGAVTSSTVVNADVSASAAITRTKLATGTPSHVVVNDVSGNLSSEAQLSVSRGGTNSGTALNNNRVMKSSGGAVVEASAITPARALVSDANGIPTHSSVTDTELGYVSGVTWGIQSQINDRALTSDLTDHTASSAEVHGISGSVVGTTDSQTLTNKTIAAGSNTITGIANANVDAAAAIAHTKLANITAGSVLMGNVSNVPTATALTGAISLSNAGVTAYAGTVPLNKGGTGQVTKAAAFDALSPMTTSGDLIYGGTAGTGTRLGIGTDGQVLKLTSGLPGWSEPPSGETNFVIGTGSNAEVATTGWSTYADAAATSPVDGTGGSPSVTFTRTTSSPLMGSGSFLFTKGASNRQGDGASYAFTIDSGYKAKVLQIEFEYIVSSGTFVAGTSSADSDIVAYVYDVTNSTLIQPTTYKLFCSSTTTSCRFTSNFQSSATGTSYRLILHTGSTSASAYTLMFDDVKVKPSTYTYGTPITDWASYTPTMTHGSGGITNATAAAKYRRVGDDIEVVGAITFSGTSAAFSQLRISPPSGLSFDSAKMASTTAYVTPLGTVNSLDSGVVNYALGAVVYSSTSAVEFLSGPYITTHTGTVSSAATIVSNTFPFTFGNLDTIGFEFRAPIAGWTSSVQMSDMSASRPIIARFSTSTARTVNNTFPTVIYETVETDSAGAYSASTGTYTIPMPGMYKISGSFITTPIVGGIGQSNAILLKKNGTFTSSLAACRVQTTTSTSQDSVGSTSLYLAAGDLITIGGYADTANTLLVSTPKQNWVTIERVADPSVISLTESISASYATSNTRTINNTNITVVYDSKIWDSHGIYNSSTGVGIIPVSGEWEVQGCLFEQAVVHAVGNQVAIYLKKNGSVDRLVGINVATTTSSYASGFCGKTNQRFNAGDTFAINVYSDTSNTLYPTQPNMNHFTIRRVGN